MTSEQIIHEYHALVRSIALTYKNKGIELEDLVQEGFIGLLEAHKRYDSTQNVKFSTYAVYWIKKYILHALELEYQTKCNALEFNSDALEPVCNNADSISENDTAGELSIKLSSCMPIIEQKVIRLSYEQCMPLKSIAQKLGISIEKVRQIRQKALRRIKSNYHKDNF